MAPLCPGSMKTTMPAMLAGVALADEMIGVAAATSTPTIMANPTRGPTRRSTAQR
ncbi:Uncharacterised protein [Mycobacterium tuberculosis]|nr:Uncharacterised protein [Mycobacterium tuberculosis]